MIRPLHERARSLRELADFLGVECHVDALVSGATHSSNEVLEGDLFLAIPGALTHGARFADQAVERGAVAVLTDAEGAAMVRGVPSLVVNDVRSAAGLASAWIYGEPTKDLECVGITGTNGKTTTSYLVYQILQKAGRESALIGTIETRLGQEKIESSRTTPEAPEFQSLAAIARERHMRHLVAEVSSHSIALKRVKGAHFKVVAFTNLSQDHLDFHPSMDHYFQTKAALFTHEYGEIAIINIDDSYGAKLADSCELPYLSTSRSNVKADWHFTRIEENVGATEFSMRGRGGILIESKTHLQGGYNLDNLLMAVAITEYLGIDPIEIATLIPELVGAPGRLEAVALGQPFKAFVDYAHSPDAVENVLKAVRQITDGKIIAVLGCGGDRDASKRPLMGRALKEMSDIAIFTSDNPRSEHPATILEQMVSEVEISSPSCIIEDRRGAIEHAVALASTGDTVIILGKGHETGQEVHGVVTPFDDRLVLAHAIEAKP